MSDDGDWEDLSGDELVLPDLSTELSSSAADSGADATAIIPDEDWLNAAKSPPVVQPVGASASATGSNDGGVYSSNNDASNGKPMILVDFTVLSEGVSGTCACSYQKYSSEVRYTRKLWLRIHEIFDRSVLYLNCFAPSYSTAHQTNLNTLPVSFP
jgi:hypothetical protein